MDEVYKGFNIFELAKMALEKPEDFGWWGKEEMFVSWGWSGIDKNAASDPIEISNFDFISDDLMRKFPHDFEIVTLRHWAVNTVERLTCRILIDPYGGLVESNITEAFWNAMEWLNKLEEYPVADDDHLDAYCYSEMAEWIKSELPDEVYISKSIDETVAQIINFMDDYDDSGESYLSWVLDGRYPTEDMIIYLAYELGMCDARYSDFWNEWVENQNLPAIYWGENFGIPQNDFYGSEDQLNLFEDNNDKREE